MLVVPTTPPSAPIGALADDLACAAGQVEQRIKGIVIGAVAGAVGMTVLFVMFGGEVLPLVAAIRSGKGRRK